MIFIADSIHFPFVIFISDYFSFVIALLLKILSFFIASASPQQMANEK